MRKLIGLFFVALLLGCAQTQLTAEQIIEKMSKKVQLNPRLRLGYKYYNYNTP